jgi:hypothetical protein
VAPVEAVSAVTRGAVLTREEEEEEDEEEEEEEAP